MPALTSFLEMLEPLQPVVPLARPDAGRTEIDAHAAARIIVEAEARAADVIDGARDQADMLLEDARIQADTLREAAWQEGYHSGQDAGRAEIEAQLRDEWEAEKRDLRAYLSEMVDAIGEARRTLWERQEAEMAAFVLTVARQVVKTEVTQNPEVIRAVIQNALRRVTDKEQVRIRVSPGDAASARGMRDEIIAMTDGLRQLEIIDDRRVGDGGCVIETGAGTIDARIETQLAEVERAVDALSGGTPA